MATNQCFIIFIQLLVFVFHKSSSQTLPTVSCGPVLSDYFGYLTAPTSGVVRSLRIQATFILQNRYVAYYNGYLSYVASVDSLNGTVTVSFSDRSWTPSCGSLFCFSSQNFNYKQTDTQTIVINRSGSIQYILNSWGNAKYTDQLQCYGVNKPLYTAPTLQSPSMFVMTLEKQQYSIPK